MRQTTTAGVRHNEGKATSFRRDERESIDFCCSRHFTAVKPWPPKNQTMPLACTAIQAKTLS
jgi:hypothetical protein